MKNSIIKIISLAIAFAFIFSCKQEKEVPQIVERQKLESKQIELVDTIYGDKTNPGTQPQIVRSKHKVYTVPNQLPVLRKCGKLPTLDQRYQCSSRELSSYISNNLRYPKTSFQNEVEGVVVVQFIVTEKGIPKYEKIVQSVDEHTDAEVLRLIRKMRKDKIRWDPGIVKAKKVKVMQTLPVNFKIS